MLGQPDGSLQVGDHIGEWGGELSSSSVSQRSVAPWAGLSTWPSAWRLDSAALSTKLLNLAAMDMKLVAVNETPDMVIRYGCRGPG